MFPSREVLADVVGREAVAFEEHPFALVLAAHHATGSSGMLAARRGRIEKRVLLDRGVPVDCRSNLVHETLSRYLVTAGKLSDSNSNAALARASARGRLLGEMLVEEGALQAAELQRLLHQNLARKLFDLFTWQDGEARFEPGEHRSETAQRLKVPRLLLTGVERFAPQPVVDRQVASFAAELLGRVPESESLLADVRPSEPERRLLDALATPARIEELMRRLEAPASDLARWIWGFALVGLVGPARSAPPQRRREEPATPAEPPVAAFQIIAPSPPPAAPVPAPAAPAAAEAVAVAVPSSSPAIAIPLRAETERLRERVLRRFAEHDGADPFELLGVGDEATLDEIRESFVAFAREFGPWRFEQSGLRDIAEPARELFFAGAIAFGRLANPHERESLRVARRDRRDAAVRASRASYFKIETDLLDAEAQFAKGVALEAAGKWDLALQQFEFAVDCDAQNGAYRAEAARARFRLAPSQMASKALEELREAQRVDPTAATAFLYAGEICLELRRFAEAEIHLRKAAHLLGPGDRRALDALADLGQRKRKKR